MIELPNGKKFDPDALYWAADQKHPGIELTVVRTGEYQGKEPLFCIITRCVVCKEVCDVNHSHTSGVIH